MIEIGENLRMVLVGVFFLVAVVLILNGWPRRRAKTCSQNFFANAPETPRLDAGRGLLLQGDGSGKLQALSAKQSGIEVYGEQRGAATADFDRDGRMDLVVTENGAATKLYRNRSAKPGLRVRLVGPTGNPRGIGATIRLGYAEQSNSSEGTLGPAREIHAGSGYWSQDSAIQVLRMGTESNGAHAQISVRWPGGQVSRVAVPAGATEITVTNLVAPSMP